MPTTADWINAPEWGAAVTLLAYAAALLLRSRVRWMHPLFTSSAAIIALLLVTGLSYDDYRIGGDLVIFMLGPATVALGVPLYKYGRRLRGSLTAVAAGVTVGSAASIASGWLLASLTGLAPQMVYSLLPKSVTTAVSVPLSAQLGGIPEMTAVFTVLTGLTGSMFGPVFLRRMGVRADLPLGVAMGTSSHGIGTARLVGDSPWQGSVSALSMSISCIVTPLLMLPLYWWLQ
jgi:predicted murein hydrolase (TIGR00659 family)